MQKLEKNGTGLELLKKTKKKTKNTGSYMDLPTLHTKKS